MKRVGYIGLGIMGRPMAENLLKAGFDLTVWNRTRSKAAAVLELGATWADSPGEVAARSEAVCINVTGTADVEQVVFGKKGVVEGNPGDTPLVIIDHSTISPEATRHFASRVAEMEVDYVDAPVSGGDTGARAGTLAVMIGGRDEVVRRCMPIFEAVGRTITHVGPVGSGQACKAVNQVMVAVNLLGVCEALALAKKEGLDLETVMKAVGGGAAGSWSLANLGPRIAGGDFDPGFMIELLNKDLNIVHDEAAGRNLPMPGTHLAADLFRSAAAMGFGRDGTQALARVFEKLGKFRYH